MTGMLVPKFSYLKVIQKGNPFHKANTKVIRASKRKFKIDGVIKNITPFQIAYKKLRIYVYMIHVYRIYIYIYIYAYVYIFMIYCYVDKTGFQKAIKKPLKCVN